MALILFTVTDTEDGPQVSVISEPRLDNPHGEQSEAMKIALLMLEALPRPDHIGHVSGDTSFTETKYDAAAIADAMIAEASNQLN